MNTLFQLTSLFFILISIAYRLYAPHFEIKHMNNEDHGSFELKNLFSKQDFQNLLDFVRTISFEITIKADITSYEDYFGSSEISEDGKCPSLVQHPNLNKTKCIIPTRLDIVKHYFLTGGYKSKKEYLSSAAARGLIFQSFLHARRNETNIPEIITLFKSEEYRKKSLAICEGKPVLDPIQVSFLINIPGQEVATHYDIPWFEGGDRFNMPSWLLISMEKSGIYHDKRIPQVQGVAYLHQWCDIDQAEGGFFFYPHGPGGVKVLVPALSNNAIILDGSKVAHATQTFRPKAVNLFLLDKNEDYLLKYNGLSWDLLNKRNNTFLRNYNDEDLRISLVWRQRCFESEEKKNNYHKGIGITPFEPKKVIDELLDDLIKKGKITEKPKNEVDIITTIVYCLKSFFLHGLKGSQI